MELVLGGPRCGVAPRPECLDELIALFVVGELLACLALLVRDDPANVLVQPLLVGLAQFLTQRLGVGLLLFFTERTLQWVCFLLFGGCGLLAGVRFSFLSEDRETAKRSK